MFFCVNRSKIRKLYSTKNKEFQPRNSTQLNKVELAKERKVRFSPINTGVRSINL
jgi:hypothetical protein